MTLHAFDLSTNKSMRWVAVPLEFVDWMAAHFSGELIQHLRRIDPYTSVRIPESVLESPIEELVEVRESLKRRSQRDIPEAVDIYGRYGTEGALTTVKELLEFFEFTKQAACKVVSIGD
jgi:hypothetical protein